MLVNGRKALSQIMRAKRLRPKETEKMETVKRTRMVFLRDRRNLIRKHKHTTHTLIEEFVCVLCINIKMWKSKKKPNYAYTHIPKLIGIGTNHKTISIHICRYAIQANTSNREVHIKKTTRQR